MTHAQLVTRAAAWLRGRHKCIAVLTEHTGAGVCGERPDALGWRRDGTTILVECKTNTADFRRDRMKPGRRIPELQHGRERWYLLDPECWMEAARQVELVPGWGIAWAEYRIRIHIGATPDPNWTTDRDAIFLIRELQRYQIQGMKPRPLFVYRRDQRNRWSEAREARQLMRIEAPDRPREIAG